MIRWSVAAVAAGVLVLAACTGSGSGSSTDAAPASSAGVESAASGEVAGNYVDNKGRCTSYWNYDTTANVQLLNKMQLVPRASAVLKDSDVLVIIGREEDIQKVK
jgi:hypothetical protein